MQVVDLQNWVSKLQTHVESQTSTYRHHRRETVTTRLTERGLASKLSVAGRMVGVHHKLTLHPTSKCSLVSFFSELSNTKQTNNFKHFSDAGITCHVNVAKGERLMLHS